MFAKNGQKYPENDFKWPTNYEEKLPGCGQLTTFLCFLTGVQPNTRQFCDLIFAEKNLNY